MTNKFSPLNNKAEILKNKLLPDNPGLTGAGISLINTDGINFELINKYLDPAEISHSKNRQSSMAGRIAAKNAINQTLNTTIPYKEISILSSSSSRPVIFSKHEALKNTPNLALSITHEDGLAAAIAVSSNHKISVGIDIARIDRVEKAFKDKKVFDYVLTPGEQELYKDTPDSALFWSCKEASAKALGIGIWHGGYLKDIEITNIAGLIEMRFKNKLRDLFMSRGYKSIKIYITTDNIYKMSVALLNS